MPDAGWPLCIVEASDESRLRDVYRAIYLSEYVRGDVRDWAGRRVCFHLPTFDHAFSAASDYRLSAGVHDRPLALERLQRIRWIALAIRGEGVSIEVLAQLRSDSRGRMRKRRTLVVLDNSYVVVLEPNRRDGYEFDFVTAFQADRAYLDRIRRGAQVVERRRQK